RLKVFDLGKDEDDFDILGDNKKFAILPPSSFDTLTGRRQYEYVEGYSLLDNPEHLLPAPRWLIKVLTPGKDDYQRVQDSFLAKKMPVSEEEYDLFGTGDEVEEKQLRDGTAEVDIKSTLQTCSSIMVIQKSRKKLTAYFGGRVDDWTFTHDSDTSIKISRESQYCLVQRGHEHKDSGHSCIFINYNRDPLYVKSIVLSCFSHGSVECTDDLFAAFGWQVVQREAPKEPTMVQCLWDDMEEYAAGHRLKRLNVDDPKVRGKVFELVDSHRWVYRERWATYGDFISSVIPTHKLTVRAHLIDDMVNMLEKIKTDDFPQFQLSRRFVAFRDGVWDLETLQFHDMESGVPGDIVARLYINEPFPHGDP
ncbi:hypothetical protein HK102_008248, partial [Quaeritorhiza haematococci]